MTDREKLLFIAEEVGKQLYLLNCWIHNQVVDKEKLFAWQPTGRACFDKPAGVPILRGETVE